MRICNAHSAGSNESLSPTCELSTFPAKFFTATVLDKSSNPAQPRPGLGIWNGTPKLRPILGLDCGLHFKYRSAQMPWPRRRNLTFAHMLHMVLFEWLRYRNQQIGRNFGIIHTDSVWDNRIKIAWFAICETQPLILRPNLTSLRHWIFGLQQISFKKFGETSGNACVCRVDPNVM